MDILKVTYDVRQINRSGPPSLVVEMTLSAPPEARLASYGADATAGEDCFVEAAYRPGTAIVESGLFSPTQFLIGCGSDAALVDSKSVIKDNVIMWSIALDSLPKPIRDAKELKELSSYSQFAEPATGIYGNGDQDLGEPGVLPTDGATTDKTFKFA